MAVRLPPAFRAARIMPFRNQGCVKVQDMPNKLLHVLAVGLACGLASCASPPSGQQPAPQAQKTSDSKPAAREEAEIVTGSRLPARGSQSVRTVDKEDVVDKSRVIGSPAKGN